MSFKELIQERYSVRNFADREIENCAPHSRYFSDELGALIF